MGLGWLESPEHCPYRASNKSKYRISVCQITCDFSCFEVDGIRYGSLLSIKIWWRASDVTYCTELWKYGRVLYTPRPSTDPQTSFSYAYSSMRCLPNTETQMSWGSQHNDLRPSTWGLSGQSLLRLFLGRSNFCTCCQQLDEHGDTCRHTLPFALRSAPPILLSSRIHGQPCAACHHHQSFSP